MYRPYRTRSARRGNTLIVTLSCLALLAVVGLTAVYFTSDQAKRTDNESQPQPYQDFTDNGMGALNAYLASLMYGQNPATDPTYLLNSTRGYELTRTMYSGQVGSTIAWDGVGTFDETTPPFGLSRRVFLVNHRLFPGMTNVVDPEFTGTRLVSAPIGSGGTFIPKNPAYTYPDAKDLYLASIVPATGEIVSPSYYRSWLFRDASQPAGATGLEPIGSPNANPNWMSPLGKFLTLRPRPAEHPNFPIVPADADGVYRGDVRNLPGGYYYDGAGHYIARNDSIWIDIGLPAFTTPSGKRLRPLIAPLILDLDSYLNLNVHGNQRGTGGAHASNQGWGAWEVSLSRTLGVEGQAIVAARGAALTRGGLTSRAFSKWLPAGQQLSSSAAVTWDGMSGAAPGTAPGVVPPVQGYLNPPGYGGNLLWANYPNYMTPPYDSTNTAALNHPALFIPREWSSLTNPPSAMRTFALNDSMLLHSQFAGTPGFYSSMEAGAIAMNTLRGTRPMPFPNPPQQGTTNGYRLDPAHPNRGIFTTLSANLERTAQTPGVVAGVGQTQASAAGLARSNALAGVDLNRRLADFRLDPTQALTPANLAPPTLTFGSALVSQAQIDRQLLGREIFARLIVATGVLATDAIVNADGSITIVATPATNLVGFNNLRNLAQIAANIVDYRDEDDVSTPFVWNPAAFADPFNAANFVPVLPGDVIGNHVVFGVERSRLQIHEAYSEQVNNPADTAGQKPTQNSHVRFWVELLNPGKQEIATSLDSGGAQVYWTAPASPVPFNPYRIEIGRYARPNGALTEDLGTYLTTDPTNVTGSFNPAFQPEIRFQFDSASVTGNVTLQNVGPNNGVYLPNFTLPLPPQGIMLVAPAIAAAKNSEYNPTVPDPMTGMPAPPWNSAVIANVPVAGPLQDAMAYDSGFLPTQPTDANRGDFKRHVVLLRRLANPYMPESPTNPFITVDYMDWVPAFDAVLRLQGQNADRGQLPAPGGYTAFTSRFSLGKVQPQAGLAVPTGTPTATGEPTFTFPQSMVLQQQPSAPIPNQPLTTFGYHNGTTTTGQAFPTYVPANLTAVPPTPAMLTGAVAGGGVPDTIMTPYEWLVHLDRPLVNQLELLHVTTGMPHQLTQQFIIPDPAVPPGNFAVRTHAAELFTGSSSTSLLFNTQMYRVLDMLRIHGHGEGDPLHGRKYGLININTIQDKRIWDSLFDVQAGNGFNQAQVDLMWNNLIRSRTVNMQQKYNVVGQPVLGVDTLGNPVLTPIPGQTMYDMNAAINVGLPATIYDRPFLPLGVSTINGPTSTPAGTGWVLPGTATAFMGGQGIDDTILRRLSTNPATPGVIDPTQLPFIFQNTGLHPYQQAEAARKILNNTTTVSNVFAVWLTVGYFEVENENVIPPGWPAGVPYQGQLGKEYYIRVPADARRRFFAIIDRTQVGLDPLNFATGLPTTHAQKGKPFFTSLEMSSNAAAAPATISILTDNVGQVYSDGVAQPLVAGSTIVLGVGANQEIATVGPLATTVNGVSTFPIAAVLWPTPGAVFTKNHYAGETVSNIIPGNPGPPPWLPVAPATTALQFDVNDPTFQPVVPLWTRVP